MRVSNRTPFVTMALLGAAMGLAGSSAAAGKPGDNLLHDSGMPGEITRTADGGWQRSYPEVVPVLSEPLSVLARRPLAETPKSDMQLLVPNKERPFVLPPGPRLPFQGAFVEQSAPGKGLAPGAGLINFQGLSANGVAPPDTNGAVGPNHYVQWINLEFAVYNKTGARILGPLPGNSFFSSLGGVCATHNNGDPVVVYDSLADRWQISQFVVLASEDPTSNSHQCIAVSQTSDPTGSWYLYDFKTSISAPDDFIDYEKLSTWTDAYYMTANDFCTTGTGICPAAGVMGAVYSFERPKMLLGQPARMLSYTNNTASGIGTAILITDIDGLTPPPAARPAHAFWAKTTTSLGAYTFASTWGGTPALAATALTDIAVPAVVDVVCSGVPARQCISQPAPAVDPTDKFDAISSQLMFRAAYRNHLVGAIDTESVVLNETVAGVVVPTQNPTQASVRWYEIQLQGPTPTLVQSGTFQPTNASRSMGSIAMDASGNIALGYSKSQRSFLPGDVDIFPGLAVTGRLLADPIGTMTGETVIKAGGGSQSGTGNRWGDYSNMTVDPRNGCTFWFQGEFYPVSGSFNWSTWIGTATYAPANCLPETQGTLSGTVTYADGGSPSLGAIITASPYSAATNAPAGAYAIVGKPGLYSASAQNPARACTSSLPVAASVVITNGGTTIQNFTVDGAPIVKLGTVILDDSPGNGNGIINKNECFRLTVPLRNDGCHSATTVSTTLTTATPGVSIKTGTSAYPAIAIGTSQNNSVPFELATSSGFACGTPIAITATISTSLGGFVRNFSLPTCAGGASQSYAGTLAVTDPVSDSRMGRNSISSACGGKACPGAIDMTPRTYRKFTFTNTSPAPTCYTVTGNVVAGCDPAGNQVMISAYSPSYNAGTGQICTNYVGDIGTNPTSTAPRSFNFTVPGGATFDVVVAAVAAGGTCAGYNGVVSGFPDTTTDGGRPTAVASGTATICLGNSTPLLGSGAATCSWTPIAGLSNPNVCNPLASPAVTTTYNLTVTTASGCTSANASSVTVTVAGVAPAAPTASNDGPKCAGTTLNLSTPTVAGATYSWTGPNGFVSATQNPAIANVTTAATGTYNVTFTVGGCTSAAGATTATVTACAAPTVSSIVRACASTVGGLSVTITGNNFQTNATVTLVGTPATVTALSATSITATTGVRVAAPAVTGNVVVTNPDSQTGTLVGGFTYGLRGDANNSGGLSPSDASWLNDYFAGAGPLPAFPCIGGDANSTGSLTPSDASYLNDYFAGAGPAPGP